MATGERGQILGRGPGIIRGDLDDPDRDARGARRRATDDRSDDRSNDQSMGRPAQALAHTGDVGWLDDDGTAGSSTGSRT